jgi:hypothetical protein
MDEVPEDPAVELNKIATFWCRNPTTLKNWQLRHS